MHIHLQSLLGHLLTDGRQKGTQMNDPGDTVLSNQTSDVSLVGHIKESRGTRGLELSVGEAEIRSNDVLNTVLLTKHYPLPTHPDLTGHELSTDLSASSGDQNSGSSSSGERTSGLFLNNATQCLQQQQPFQQQTSEK